MFTVMSWVGRGFLLVCRVPAQSAPGPNVQPETFWSRAPMVTLPVSRSDRPLPIRPRKRSSPADVVRNSTYSRLAFQLLVS